MRHGRASPDQTSRPPRCTSARAAARAWSSRPRWEQAGDRTHWRVWRRCPECEWAGEGVHGEGEIDAFDEQLDLGAHELADELRALEHANMSEMADAFVVALAADLIGADDFAGSVRAPRRVGPRWHSTEI